jgi:hypothetical protein
MVQSALIMKTVATCIMMSLAFAAPVALIAAPSIELAAPAKDKKPVKIGRITFEGGDGSSMEQAVVIKGAKDSEEGIDAEAKWVKKVHGKWTKDRQALLDQNGKKYDRIEYTTPKGEKMTVYFDITDFFGKF